MTLRDISPIGESSKSEAVNSLQLCHREPVERRLLLALLVAHASRKGVAEVDVSDLLKQSGFNADTFTGVMGGLVDDGLVQMVSRTPIRFRIVPRIPVLLPPHVDDSAPSSASSASPDVGRIDASPSEYWVQGKDREQEGLSAFDVQRVVWAARISTPDDAPLYWHRFGHVADLTDLLDHTGLTVNALCARLEALPPAGPVRRLRALKDSLGRAA